MDFQEVENFGAKTKFVMSDCVFISITCLLCLFYRYRFELAFLGFFIILDDRADVGIVGASSLVARHWREGQGKVASRGYDHNRCPVADTVRAEVFAVILQLIAVFFLRLRRYGPGRDGVASSFIQLCIKARAAR